MTLESVYAKILCYMYPSEHAAIVKIDSRWYMVADLKEENAYYFNTLLINGSMSIKPTLQRDHPVIWITESQASDYNISLEG